MITIIFTGLIIGKILDHYTRFDLWLIFTAFLHFAVNILYLFINPFIASVLFGIALEIRAIITMLIIGKVVKEGSVGKAYGINRALKDLFGFIVLLFNGWIA
jgi:hypothetical protein